MKQERANGIGRKMMGLQLEGGNKRHEDIANWKSKATLKVLEKNTLSLGSGLGTISPRGRRQSNSTGMRLVERNHSSSSTLTSEPSQPPRSPKASCSSTSSPSSLVSIMSRDSGSSFVGRGLE